MENKKYKISFFQNCYSNTAIEKELTFDEILKYFNINVNKIFVGKDSLEGMVCGAFSNQKRSTESLTCRSIITYDVDYYKHNLNILAEYLKDCLINNTYIYYTTVSSTFDKPKLRILLFINQNINTSDYNKISLNVAKTLFKEFFDEDNYVKISNSIESAIDKASYIPAQLMYLPCKINSDFACGKNDGELLDITQYLTTEVVENKNAEIDNFKRDVRNSPLQISDKKVNEVLQNYNVEDTNRDSWLQVCQGLHHQYKGSDIGYNLFLEWSLKDTRFTEEEIRRETKIAYQSLKSNKINPITFASIMYIVNNKRKPVVEMQNEVEKIYREISPDLFPDIKINKKGEIVKVKSTYENFEKMCKAYNIQISYDVITKKNLDSFNYTDDNITSTRLYSLLELNNMSRDVADKYMNMLAHKNTVNSFKDILDNITWDGRSRIEEFLKTVRVDEEYEDIKNVYLIKWLQQMLYLTTYEGRRKIARQILVFQSDQEIGKSTWIMSLMPEHLGHYVGEGLILNTNDEMSILKCIKHIFVELAELEQSFKKTDINSFCC